jgi:hypothetical protein
VKQSNHLTRSGASLAGLLLGLSIVGNASGQDNDALNVDVSECVALESEVARFVCYEERVESARTQGSSPPATAPAQPGTTPDNASAVRGSDQTDEPDAEEIFGTITALRETGPNIHVITLDNGQVWQMNQPRRYPLRVGLEVRLYSTRWGSSYRLTAPEHGSYVQVRRVR